RDDIPPRRRGARAGPARQHGGSQDRFQDGARRTRFVLPFAAAAMTSAHHPALRATPFVPKGVNFFPLRYEGRSRANARAARPRGMAVVPQHQPPAPRATPFLRKGVNFFPLRYEGGLRGMAFFRSCEYGLHPPRRAPALRARSLPLRPSYGRGWRRYE